jgi:hypothetical protein
MERRARGVDADLDAVLCQVWRAVEPQGGARVTCNRCGHVLRIGDFPFCTPTSGHGPWNVNVIDDQLEGGARFFENLGHEPVWVESKSQLKREMDARNLEHCSRHERAYHDRFFRQTNERYKDEKRAS